MGAGNSKENLYNAINADNPTLVTQILKVFSISFFDFNTFFRRPPPLSTNQLVKIVFTHHIDNKLTFQKIKQPRWPEQPGEEMSKCCIL